MKGIEAFANVKRLIVVAAHPDDLETVCGGVVYLLAQRGVEIYSVNCTLGDIGDREGSMRRTELANYRLDETEAAARVLGIKQTFNLGHHDGELLASLHLRAQLARLYRTTQADTLFTFDPFWAGQIHPDHRAAGQAALDAYMPSKMPLYHPEHLNEPAAGLGRIERAFLFSTTREPEIFVDVTAVMSIKLEACKAHVSQFPDGEKSLEWLKEMSQRAGEQINVPYAEVFKEIELW